MRIITRYLFRWLHLFRLHVEFRLGCQSSRVSSCKQTTRAHKCHNVAIELRLMLKERLISWSSVAPKQFSETPICCYRHMGSDAILCNCTPGFTGRRCEVPLLDPRDTAGE